MQAKIAFRAIFAYSGSHPHKPNSVYFELVEGFPRSLVVIIYLVPRLPLESSGTPNFDFVIKVGHGLAPQ